MQETKEKETVIKIHGIPFETEDTVYEVVPKYDADAPDGFRNNRTTKLLDFDAGKNTVSALFDRDLVLWDTGLYKDSPMYRGLSEEAKNSLGNKIEDLIVKPFERIYGEGKLNPRDKDSEFWNYTDSTSFKVDLYQGKLFKTKNPLDLLQLFICLSNKDLAPKKHESSPKFRKAQFCIENKEEVRSTKVETDMIDMEVNGKFYSLLSQPKTLQPILTYIGVKNINVENKELAITLFKRFVEDKEQAYQNKKLFLDAVSLESTKSGRKEIIYYSYLIDLLNKGKLKKEGDSYVIGETEVGSNLKAAAKFISKKTTMQQQVDELRQEN
jgi:hypothetical protein